MRKAAFGMADLGSSIFNQRAAEKLRSPDDLDKYVRVTSPSVWLTLAACASLVIGLLAWGTFGSVDTDVVASGTVVNGQVICLLSSEDAASVHVGDKANVNGTSCSVSEVAAIPLSRDEAGKLLKSDYLLSALMQGDWGYKVNFDADASSFASGVPLSVNITLQSEAPITLVLGGA